MLAFRERGTIRVVDVPSYKIETARLSNPDVIDEILNLTFHYGQNEIQPQKMPSVSAGDIIELLGRYYDVRPTGFQEISHEKFEKLHNHRGAEVFNE